MPSPYAQVAPEVRLRRVVPVLLAWVLGAAVFFRRSVFSGFTFITGEDGDTRLIVYLHEHWVQVFRGLAAWREPAFFHPAPDTLGYSDTFLLDQLFYAPLRWAGVDEFGSYQATLLLLSLVGYIGAYRLLRRILVAQRFLCLALAEVFTFSNMMAVQAGHTQLCAVYWIPGIVLLVLHVRCRPAARWAAFSAGLLTGLLFLSTFYVAFFGLLCAAVWLAARWCLARVGDQSGFGALQQSVVRHRGTLAAAVGGTAIGGTGFLLVYLPNFGSTRSFDVVLGYAAEPRDILNTGARNQLWGPLTRWLFGSSRRLGDGEWGFGLTPVLLVSLVLATGYLVRSFAMEADDRRVIGPALATSITCWAAIVVPVKVHGFSLWYPVWLLVPGARAIRAVDRLGIIASLLGPLVIAFVIADLLRRAATRPGVRRRIMTGAAVLTLLMAVEQINAGNNATLDRTRELHALQAVPTPPPSCRVFYLTGVTAPPRLAYLADIDAMLIAQHLTSRGTPLATINGFSGNTPDGFGAAADPGSSGYAEAIRSWATQHHITEGLCSYDQVTSKWALR